MAHFTVNKVINRIITTLHAVSTITHEGTPIATPFNNKCHNHFGDEAGTFEEILQQDGHIYIFYGNEEYENPQTTHRNEGNLFLEFWVIDNVTGRSSTETAFQADVLRNYLMSNTTGWRTLGVETDYASLNVSPFFVQSVRPVLLLDDDGNPTGYLLTVFSGYFRFDSLMK